MKKKLIIITILLIGIITIFSVGYISLKKTTLIIPKYISRDYSLKKEEFQKRDVYVLSNKEKESNLFILYFHGGTYTTNLNTTYWDFLSDVAKDTRATIIIPDYPLTPEFYYKDVFEFVIPLYEELLKKVGKENLIIMGDSAGGGLSLALCQTEGERGISQPQKLILISPWLDISMTNPEIDKVQENDPLLNKELLKLAGQAYARNLNMEEYLISPLYGPISELKNVVIFSGTYDILNPDAKKFVKRVKKSGKEIDYRETQKAVHIWLLSNRDDSVYMAKESYQELIKVIKER